MVLEIKAKLRSNCSIENGTLIRILAIVDNSEGVNETDQASGEDDYDSQGAMQFIIATVLVYSIFGVFCTLVTRISRRRGKNKQSTAQDEDIQRYLKKENSLKADAVKIKKMNECNVYIKQLQRLEEVGHSHSEQSLETDPLTKSEKKKKRIGRKKMKKKYLQVQVPAARAGHSQVDPDDEYVCHSDWDITSGSPEDVTCTQSVHAAEKEHVVHLQDTVVTIDNSD